MLRYTIAILFVLCWHPTVESIRWSQDYQLQWSDFKGRPKHHSDAVAITASGLSVGLTATTLKRELLDYSITVEAHFYPQQSWYLKGQVNNVVLAHEQLHFDITELYARKLRQEIEQAHFTLNIKKELEVLRKQVDKALKQTQSRYDSECDFSRNPEAQKRWRVFIDEELAKLSSYSFQEL
mgnify:CR=1 FL=1